MSDGPLNHYNEHDHYNRVTVDLRASDAHFRVFLVPFKIGEPHPQITYDPKTEQATLHWVDQEDIVQFTTDKANRAWVSINRGSTKILPP